MCWAKPASCCGKLCAPGTGCCRAQDFRWRPWWTWRSETAAQSELAEADVKKASALLSQADDVYVPSLDLGGRRWATRGSASPHWAALQSLIATVQSLVVSFRSGGTCRRGARRKLKAASLSLKRMRPRTGSAGRIDGLHRAGYGRPAGGCRAPAGGLRVPAEVDHRRGPHGGGSGRAERCVAGAV